MNPHNPSLPAVRPQETWPSRRVSLNRHEIADAVFPEGDFNDAARFVRRQPLVVDRQLALEAEPSDPVQAARRPNPL